MSKPHLACTRCKRMNNTDPCFACGSKNTHELQPGDVEVQESLHEDIDRARRALEQFWRRLETTNPRH